MRPTEDQNREIDRVLLISLESTVVSIIGLVASVPTR